MNQNEIREELLERFLRYVKTWTESSGEIADQGTMPSTDCQWNMAKMLHKELEELGLKEVSTSENCYVYAFLPASKGFENRPSFCLLSHMDTSEEVSGKNVQPLIHKDYADSKIVLPYGNILDPEKDKYLAQAEKNHETIITSDGSTLLGADDKAGIAEIMTALSFLVKNTEYPHGPLEVIFSPDEETGHGMDKVPLEKLKSKAAYTVDGGHEGEIENECFNAWKSEITFTGKACHTGSARGVMVNAALMASSFVSSLPKNQLPETTEGHEGFFAVTEIKASIEEAKVSLLLRDFSEQGMKDRIELIDKLSSMTALCYGGKASVKHTQQYLNMKEKLNASPLVTENLVKACKKAGIDPVFPPIRGGTDGSRLTEMGIPCPNIFTGGHNFHSRDEWASLDQMEKATLVLIELAKVWAQ